MGKPENAVESEIVRQAEANGFLCYKFVSPSRRGVPDRELIGHGLTFFIEAKAPGETLRPLQISIQGDMCAHGALIAVMDTKQQVRRFFDDLQAGGYKPNYLRGMLPEYQPAELADKAELLRKAYRRKSSQKEGVRHD